MSFSADLRGFSDRTKAKHDGVVRKTALELFRRVIFRTPVDTGRLRGNWQCTSGAPATGTIDDAADNATPANAAGLGSSTAAAAAQRHVLGADPAQPLYLTNNLPYAGVIEYDGHSQQAPAGMVRVSVAEFRDVVEASVVAVEREK